MPPGGGWALSADVKQRKKCPLVLLAFYLWPLLLLSFLALLLTPHSTAFILTQNICHLILSLCPVDEAQ